MKKHPKLLNLSVALFASVTALFVLFFVYVNHYESIDIYHARESRSYAAIETYTLEQIEDETAPAVSEMYTAGHSRCRQRIIPA